MFESSPVGESEGGVSVIRCLPFAYGDAGEAKCGVAVLAAER